MPFNFHHSREVHPLTPASRNSSDLYETQEHARKLCKIDRIVVSSRVVLIRAATRALSHTSSQSPRNNQSRSPPGVRSRKAKIATKVDGSIHYDVETDATTNALRSRETWTILVPRDLS